MRLLSTTRVPDGATLGRDILIGRPDGAPLLRAGVPLTAEYRRRLIAAGVMAIYVSDELSDGIEIDAPIDEPTRLLATKAVADMQRYATAALEHGDDLAREPAIDVALDSLNDIVTRILAQIDACGGVALALSDLCSADGYTFQHSIDVAAVGLIVGRQHLRVNGWTDYLGRQRFDQLDSRLTTLGIGLLLHDIGKMAVPNKILHKPGRLTDAEMSIVRGHPRAGVDLLTGDRWDPLVKAIVLRHHERWNGTGYPDGQIGTEIHQMARIAAVSDVYDAITSARPYADAEPASAGVRAILNGAGTLYEPTVVESFAKVVAPFPAGSAVTLSDGREGIVSRVPPERLDRPTVRLVQDGAVIDEISLLEHTELRIAGWEHDVSRHKLAVA